MTDVLEAEVRELDEPRDLVPVEAKPIVRLAAQQTPEEMIALASRMATALKDIVERQRLYATIQGKKYPQVEAWMTIGRMDNVVAREAEAPVRHDDGSYEAFVELIRLGDGAVIGRASALCGTADDKPWGSRAEPARRSMAVTRATSRAFRQQYSWIMALAGYEPTPVEEMPVEGRQDAPPAPTERPETPDSDEPVYQGQDTFTGRITIGTNSPTDGQVRTDPDGQAFVGFSLTLPTGKRVQATAEGPLALALDAATEGVMSLHGVEATVEGALYTVPWKKDGKRMPPYKRLVIERIGTPDFVLPAATE